MEYGSDENLCHAPLQCKKLWRWRYAQFEDDLRRFNQH